MDFKIIDNGTFYSFPYDQSDLKGFDRFINFLKDQKSTTFLFWQPLEFVGYPIDNIHQLQDHQRDKINQILSDNNLFFYFLYGGFDNKHYERLNNIFSNRICFLYWPTHLIHYTKYHLEKSYDRPIEEISINKNFNKLFYILNHNPRLHRAIIIDKLSKQNLLEDNIFTWNIVGPIPEDGIQYEFKHWKEKIVTLDLFEIEDYNYNFSKLLTPNFLNLNSLFNLNAETNYRDYYFITEKTYKNILIEQPFFTFGTPGINKKIQELGFVLYDEIINYSFDNEGSLEDRVDQYINNLIRINKLNYNSVYQKIEDKIQFNKRRALEIIDKDYFIPDFVSKSFIENLEVYKKIFSENSFVYPYIFDVINQFLPKN